ncbi:MAG: A/G-specific adenine glycosylase [Thermodesulfobacteriota bacterium]
MKKAIMPENMAKLTQKEIIAFQDLIYGYFREHGRDLPWRATWDPYRILVSEIMLQQTQVERVLHKYEPFIAKFPDVACLAREDLGAVLAAWQGLGYNRRCIALQRTARIVAEEFGGRLPDSVKTLQTLPGIGKATSGALVAFAFNKPVVFVETNIRRVFIHCFFSGKQAVKDRQILPLVEATLDQSSPRSWYYALMDYGATLKPMDGNPNRRSAHYSRQTRFEGSDRQIRGLIIKAALRLRSCPMEDIIKEVGKQPERVVPILDCLIREGFLERRGNQVRIASGQP